MLKGEVWFDLLSNGKEKNCIKTLRFLICSISEDGK
jgi:hypothetical protein